MIHPIKILQAGFVCLALLLAPAAFITSAKAQSDEISKEHLDLALKTMLLGRGSTSFERVIPDMANRVKDKLIRQRPDLQREIVEITDNVALGMADRLVDLDKAIASGWAKNFSQEELTEIAAFFSTPTGEKFAKNQANIINATMKAADRFAAQIEQDILKQVKEDFQKQGTTF